MPRWFSVRFIRQIQCPLQSKWARPSAALLALLIVMPPAALAQGSPFDTGFNAIQSPDSRTANLAQKKRSLELLPERALLFSP